MTAEVGVVAIGRNEGERLDRCLASLLAQTSAVVYVDSGSADGSAGRARTAGVRVVELDPAHPFTAARARNEGLARLLEEWPGVDFAQFVDGDCELVEGWLEAGASRLAEQPELGAVTGRRRERHPEASPYNRVIDMEWDTPLGEALACGGDAMVRVEAFRAAGGYDARLIAGEDPEFCLRLRRTGYRILRVDGEMTRHDAALLRFDQWWTRQKRAGHAYAEAAWLHRDGRERYRLRETASAIGWGLALPLAAFLGAPASGGWSLLLPVLYPLLWLRVATRGRRPGGTLYASACLLGKFAEAQGVLGFCLNHFLLRRASRLIEYKGPAPGKA